MNAWEGKLLQADMDTAQSGAQCILWIDVSAGEEDVTSLHRPYCKESIFQLIAERFHGVDVSFYSAEIP